MKKSRQQVRNEIAELVCRELRFQIGQPIVNMDLEKTASLLIKWMKVAKKNKYQRP